MLKWNDTVYQDDSQYLADIRALLYVLALHFVPQAVNSSFANSRLRALEKQRMKSEEE